jgi:DNA-binding CsgD family transcriptional regulator
MTEISSYHPGLPDGIYKRIYDFLLLVGNERNPGALCRSFVREITKLVPFDKSAFHLIGPDLTIRESEAPETPLKSTTEYIEYYSRIDCLKQQTAPDSRVMFANWDVYRNTEYVTDFLAPLKIKFSAVLIFRDWLGRPAASIALNREGNPGFSQRDLAVLQTIQPQIENLFANLTVCASINTENFNRSDWMIRCPVLTGREAEVAALLCRRLKRAEISVLLSISPRTVQKHIENIYTKLRISSRAELIGIYLSR